jgi:hypothetical protein
VLPIANPLANSYVSPGRGVWARIVHAVIMLSGFSKFMARTFSFTVAWLALLVIAWEIFSHTM